MNTTNRNFKFILIITVLAAIVVMVFNSNFYKPPKGELESIAYRAYGDAGGSYIYYCLSKERDESIILKTSIAASSGEKKVETDYSCTPEDFEAVEDFLIENGLLRKGKINTLPTLSLDTPTTSITIWLKGKRYLIYEGQKPPTFYREKIPALQEELSALARPENIIEP